MIFPRLNKCDDDERPPTPSPALGGLFIFEALLEFAGVAMLFGALASAQQIYPKGSVVAVVRNLNPGEYIWGSELTNCLLSNSDI